MAWDIWKETLRIDDKTPLYQQLENIILRYIKEHNLKPGDMVPPEVEFCLRYHLSRSTVRQAFKQLEAKGLIIRRRGLGSFVAEPKISRNLGYLYSFTKQLTEMGYQTSSQVLRFEETALSEDIAAMLGLTPGTLIYDIERLRLANGQPMLLENTLVIKSFSPPLSAETLETGSLYKLLKDHGLQMARAIESYEPTIMDKKTQRLLQCESNPCAFLIRRKSYTHDNQIFEYTRSIMPGQRSRLEITLLEDSILMTKYE